MIKANDLAWERKKREALRLLMQLAEKFFENNYGELTVKMSKTSGNIDIQPGPVHRV